MTGIRPDRDGAILVDEGLDEYLSGLDLDPSGGLRVSRSEGRRRVSSIRPFSTVTTPRGLVRPARRRARGVAVARSSRTVGPDERRLRFRPAVELDLAKKFHPPRRSRLPLGSQHVVAPRHHRRRRRRRWDRRGGLVPRRVRRVEPSHGRGGPRQARRMGRSRLGAFIFYSFSYGQFD